MDAVVIDAVIVISDPFSAVELALADNDTDPTLSSSTIVIVSVCDPPAITASLPPKPPEVTAILLISSITVSFPS